MFLLNYFSFELRKWMRDTFTAVVLFYPLLFGSVGRFLLPILEKEANLNLAPYYAVIVVSFGMMTAKILGAVVGFSILDDRDDNILYTVRVAPLSLEVFIGLKLLLIYVVSVLGTAFVMWFSNLVPISAGVLWSIAFLAGFQAPLLALLINYVASNKVEGFAAIKGLNVLVLFPIAALFFTGFKEFIFAIEPSFWPAKALFGSLSGVPQQLSYNSYYFIGLAYVVVAIILVYRAFAKKVY